MNSEKLNRRVAAISAAAIAVLFSGHALQTILPYTTYIILMAAAVTLPFTANDIARKNLNLARSALLAITAMTALTLIKELGQYYLTYAFMLAIVFVAFRITQSYSFDTVMNIFLKLMTLVTLVSLVCYILLNTTSMLDWLPRYENVNGAEYGVGVIYNYIVDVPERNCGMFWEPGMFATFLTYSIVLEIAFNKGKIHVFRLVVYSFGIITANSTAGFVLLLLAAVLLLARSSSDKVRYYIGSGIVIFILVFAPIVIANLDNIINSSSLAGNPYIQKLLSDNLTQTSRTVAFSVNIKIFLQNPLLGAGIIPSEEQIRVVADTSTSTFLLAAFGIPGILYTIFLIKGILRQQDLNILTKVILVAIFIIIVNKEPHQQILFTWCLIFYMLDNDHLTINSSKEIIDEDTEKAQVHQS